MKKLMFMLTSLLLGASSALAEEAATELVTEAAPKAIDTGKLLGDGLIVTAGGLCGVFLVLILFFFTIKLLQKVLK